MKKYYLVSVEYNNTRYPFRNQVYEADSEQHAIKKFHDSWTRIDDDEIISVKAKYLGISENIARWIEYCIGFLKYILFRPYCIFLICVEMIFYYDPYMFKFSENRGEPYRKWIYLVSYLGRPVYWLRVLFNKRQQVWINVEHDMLKEGKEVK